MIARYQTLAQRIRLELEEIERTHQVIHRHWQSVRTSTSDQDAFLNSVALNLHGLYSGLERIFELIAIEIDGGPLGGEAWHTELLRQMTLDLPATRPPVLLSETANQLDEYRKFRHRIRNIYATQLDPERMEPLVANLPALWKQVVQELNAFAAFLDQLAQANPD